MFARMPLGAFALACALFYVVAVASSEGAPTAKPVNKSLPVITGTPQQGQTLTATSGTWTSSTTLTYAYQWRRCSASGNACANIGSPRGSVVTAAREWARERALRV
jgi:hypothetical protein